MADVTTLITRAPSSLLMQFFSGKPWPRGHTLAQGVGQAMEIDRGASTAPLVELIRTMADQDPGHVPASEMKAVKLLTGNAPHQLCVFFRESSRQIHLQSPPGCDLRFFVEIQVRCQGIDMHGRCLEEAGDQHIPKRLHDCLGVILVSDGV